MRVITQQRKTMRPEAFAMLSLVLSVGILGPTRLLIAQAATIDSPGQPADDRRDSQAGPFDSSARNFITLLSNGEFQQAATSFDDTMKRVLPPQKLSEAWNQLIREVGALQEQGEIHHTSSGDYQIVDVSCTFQRGNRVVRVTFDKAGQISGLFFRPARGMADQPNFPLVTSFLVAVLVELGSPLLLAIFLWRRFQCRWRIWLIGVAVFFIFQMLTRLPIVWAIQSAASFQALLQQPVYLWTNLLVLSFTAGLFEEGGRALAFRFVISPEDRNWKMAVMFGAGHGGLEAFGVGVLVFLSLITYLVVLFLPAGTWGVPQQSIELTKETFATMPGWEPLLGAWERLGALLIQLALSVMVLQAFLRSKIWWWCALLSHTLVNFGSLTVLQLGSKAWGSKTAMVATEGLVTAFALLSLWFVIAMRRRETDRALPAPGVPIATDLG